jgi:hypothetical protein
MKENVPDIFAYKKTGKVAVESYIAWISVTVRKAVQEIVLFYKCKILCC